jgi:hypothetical protein
MRRPPCGDAPIVRTVRELVAQWSRNLSRSQQAWRPSPPAEASTLAWTETEFGDLDRLFAVRVQHLLHEFRRVRPDGWSGSRTRAPTCRRHLPITGTKPIPHPVMSVRCVGISLKDMVKLCDCRSSVGMACTRGVRLRLLSPSRPGPDLAREPRCSADPTESPGSPVRVVASTLPGYDHFFHQLSLHHLCCRSVAARQRSRCRLVDVPPYERILSRGPRTADRGPRDWINPEPVRPAGREASCCRCSKTDAARARDGIGRPAG